MPLSRLQRRPQPDAEGFYPTDIPVDLVHEDQFHTAQVGKEVALITRVKDQMVAFSRLCPHAAADLGQGRLARGQIKCPDHGYTFDIRSGRATWPEGEGCHLRRFSVREKDGLVWVKPGL